MKSGITHSFLTKAIASVCFIGFLPLVPGTFGSLAGAGLFYLINAASKPIYLLFVLGVLLLGLLTGGKMEKLLNKKDPSCVVIDEVMGMLVALSFMPADLKIIILGFIIFRILDTLKPFPCERLQYMHGAAGIMGDDLVAGIYTNIILQIILKIAPLVTAS